MHGMINVFRTSESDSIKTECGCSRARVVVGTATIIGAVNSVTDDISEIDPTNAPDDLVFLSIERDGETDILTVGLTVEAATNLRLALGEMMKRLTGSVV